MTCETKVVSQVNESWDGKGFKLRRDGGGTMVPAIVISADTGQIFDLVLVKASVESLLELEGTFVGTTGMGIGKPVGRVGLGGGRKAYFVWHSLVQRPVLVRREPPTHRFRARHCWPVGADQQTKAQN